VAKAAKEKTGESRTESGKKEGPQNTADNKEANMAKRARKKQDDPGQNQGKKRVRRIPRIIPTAIHRILPWKKLREVSIGSGGVLPVLLPAHQPPLAI
jgi:ribonuclease PH